MQSLKWFFYYFTPRRRRHVENSIGQMKCLENLSHASEKTSLGLTAQTCNWKDDTMTKIKTVTRLPAEEKWK